MRNFSLSGSALVFLGAFFWSLSAPITKFLNVEPFTLCAIRSAFAFVAMAVFIRPRQLKWNGWMVMYLLSYCALCTCVIVSLSMTAAPIAIGMQFTAAIWLFLVELLLCRRFSLRKFIPVCIITVGVVFFMCSATDATSATGNLIALFEGIIFACLSVSAKKAAGTNPLGLTALGNLLTALLVFALTPASVSHLANQSSQSWLLMAILGVVQVGGGYAFYNLGIQKIPARKASVIALWEMILGPVWVALLLGEFPTPMVLTGFVIIIVGILLDAKLSVRDE